MTAAALSSTALFVWSRRRMEILTCAGIYLVLYVSSETLSPQETRPYLEPALTFLQAAPFFLPLVLFVSTTSIFTLDLSGRESRFPRQFFTLPVNAQQMVLPMMLLAVLLAALLWVLAIGITDGRVLLAGPLDGPAHLQRRQGWFPFLLTSLIVWGQALIWMPTRRKWVRVGALLALVTVYGAMLIVSIRILPSIVVIAFSLAQLPLAYAVAVRGVANARRGEPAPTQGKAAPRPVRTFASAFEAQCWFERHIHRWTGKSTMIWLVIIALWVLLILAAIAAAGAGQEGVSAAAALAEPVISLLYWTLAAVSVIAGTTFASFHPTIRWYQNDTFAMPPFFAALPFSTGHFVWAKMRTAMINMAWVCAFVIGLTVAISVWAGLFDEWFQAVLPAAVFVSLSLAATASVMWLALLGRYWNFINLACAAAVMVALVMFWIAVSGPVGFKGVTSALAAAVKIGAPLKVLTLAALVHRVGFGGHFPWTRLAGIVVWWLTTVVGLFFVIRSTVPPGSTSSLTVICASIVAAPVLGILAAPLALQGNRCR